MKTCRECGKTKPVDAFAIYWKNPDGRNLRCRACMSVINKKNRRPNRITKNSRVNKEKMANG